MAKSYDLKSKIDFNDTIFNNRLRLGRPFLAAHRGVYGANVPCNSLAAFTIAVKQGADVVEIDVTKTKDGKYFVFHPGMEPQFLKSDKYISDMTYDEVKKLRLYNYDGVITHYEVPELQDVFKLLKGKVYINVDKFWLDVKGITEEIRKAGVEKQVIVKSFADEKSFSEIKQYASDLMYMGVIWNKDERTDRLTEMGLNVIGEEILFSSINEEVFSDEYIKNMHAKQKLVWVNSIIYNEKDIIAAQFTDDASLTGNTDDFWGKLIAKNVDFIQTDWLIALRNYLLNR